jgi:hypothetical protein
VRECRSEIKSKGMKIRPKSGYLSTLILGIYTNKGRSKRLTQSTNLRPKS